MEEEALKKKKEKRKKLFLGGCIVVPLILFLLPIFVFGILNVVGVVMVHFAKGDTFLAAYDSPNGTYTLKLNQQTGTWANDDHETIGVLVTNKNEREKTIYFDAYREYEEVEWLDDDTVVINNVTLDVPGDTYFNYDLIS